MKDLKEISGPSIKIKNIFLVETNFKRELDVDFSENSIKTDVKVNVSHTIENNDIQVTEEIEFYQTLNSKIVLTITAKMIGYFTKVGEVPYTLEDFGKRNAPAIIFPFLREHISGLMSRAGLGMKFIPPINFVQNAVKPEDPKI